MLAKPEPRPEAKTAIVVPANVAFVKVQAVVIKKSNNKIEWTGSTTSYLKRTFMVWFDLIHYSAFFLAANAM